ncbi:unnamed protein product [Lepeophtheirus salmonis]|uniref:(salmon louse) hypothetical protein n=1 Tax=Lepeophtheirus salmonis TaxID=72036 RepID=A0A7R8D8Z4_LEPSM|nr:unnamed protein product [Lepeophtheirus salmonis]CAF3039066.1 unnamed protein product [Lepeophtheirus salmonis]
MLRRSLRRCRFFLDEILEHARLRRNLSEKELISMFRHSESVQKIIQASEKNPDLNYNLSIVFSENEIQSMRNSFKTLYLTLLNNLRLGESVLANVLKVTSKISHSVPCEDVFNENINCVRPLLIHLLEDHQHRKKTALVHTKDQFFSKSFLSLPLTFLELEMALLFIQQSVELFVQAAQSHESLMIFVVKLTDKLLECRRNDVIHLLVDIFETASLNVSESLLGYLSKYKLDELQHEIYQILNQKLNYNN